MNAVRVAALVCCAAAFGQPLRELADRRGVRIGAAVDPSRLAEPEYAETLAREFNQAEPENMMKFGLIHPAADRYNFAPADAIVAFAREHRMAVRGHTLVWHNQMPPWVAAGNPTPAQLAAILPDHIHSVVGHYAGQVYAWDVVNEAFLDYGSLRGTIWYNTPGVGLEGTGYIERALRWAHKADPKARLFYNDYAAERVNSKSDAIYKMAKDFKGRGVSGRRHRAANALHDTGRGDAAGHRDESEAAHGSGSKCRSRSWT
jgi:endo-1,4-beta-xylanase